SLEGDGEARSVAGLEEIVGEPRDLGPGGVDLQRLYAVAPERPLEKPPVPHLAGGDELLLLEARDRCLLRAQMLDPRRGGGARLVGLAQLGLGGRARLARERGVD